MYLSETYEKKCLVLEHADLPKITDSYSRHAAVTATILKTKKAHPKKIGLFLNEIAPANATRSSIDNRSYPNFISKNTMPNLIAYDIAVQPMTESN